MKKDDNAVSVLIEYILSLFITTMLFTIIILLLNNTIFMTNQVVMNEQLGIISGNIANRISIFSNNIYNNQYKDNYYNNTISNYTTSLALPPSAQGDQYVAEIYYFTENNTGFVKVLYGLNNNINKTTSFYSNISVLNCIIFSNSNDVKICYSDSKDFISLSVS